MIKIIQHIKKIITMLSILATLALIPLYITHISLYDNNPNIYIEGLKYINESAIIDVIMEDDIFNFNFNIREIKKKVEGVEFVKNASVSFILPNIYIIQIIERIPITLTCIFHDHD